MSNMQQSDQDQKRTKPKTKRNKKHILKGIWVVIQVLIVVGLMGVIFAGAVAAGFFASHVQDERLRDSEEIYNSIYNLNRTSEAYFSNNEIIGQLRTAEVSQPVSIDEVSPHLINAILAIEDHIFYEHMGINPKAILRAVIEMFLTGGEGTGGSTITQQLVKNQFLDPSRSFERKFKEMLLAMRVERVLEKDDILEAYMNIVYMGFNVNGTNIEGVQAAAQGIFGVDAADLNLAQAAYIAGMIHSPGRYTPFTPTGEIVDERLERGLERMTTVLNRMLETEMITQAEYDEAIAFDMRSSLAKPTPGIVEKYPYLTFEIEKRVIDILTDKMMEEQGLEFDSLSEEEQEYYLELARRQMSQGGYKIYTTIDRQLYEAFHEIAQNPEYFGPRSTQHTYTSTDPETGEEVEIGYLEQAAATLIDNETGAIIAMIEGRDFEELQYNLTTEPRQPGSSIKPLLDYAPAFELGILQPASIIDDSPIFAWDVSSSKYWIPRNYNGNYLGLMTVREALKRSYNIPAIKAFLKVQEEAGQEVPFEFLKKMGITTIQEQDYHAPSVSIGGFTYGLTVEENTNAYSVFANNGIFLEAYMIERIEDHEGQIIYEHEIKPQQVYSEQTAFLINDLLRSVVNQGTAAKIRSELGAGLDVAGKTGTTNDKYDYWFVGYTPQISMGLWIGYDKREPLQSGYSSRNHHLWVTLLKTVEEIRPDLVDPERRFEMARRYRPGHCLFQVWHVAVRTVSRGWIFSYGLFQSSIPANRGRR